jgi:hypothetical protein
MTRPGNPNHQPYQTVTGRRDRDPVTCGCCGREASGLGYADDRRPIMWICTQCPPIAQEVYRMSPKALSIFENNACLDAAKAVAMEQAETILSALFDAGITDLSAMTREQFEAVVATMTSNGSLSAIAQSTLLAFAESMRRQAEDGKEPF